MPVVSGEDRAAGGRPTEDPRLSRAQRGLAAGERWQPAAVLLSAAARGQDSPLSTAAAAAAAAAVAAGASLRLALRTAPEVSARGMGTGAGPPEEARRAAEGARRLPPGAPGSRRSQLAALGGRLARGGCGHRAPPEQRAPSNPRPAGRSLAPPPRRGRRTLGGRPQPRPLRAGLGRSASAEGERVRGGACVVERARPRPLPFHGLGVGSCWEGSWG